MNLILGLVASYIGFPLGIFLGSISSEELQKGVVFLKGIQKILLSIILFFFIYGLFSIFSPIFSSIFAGILTLLFLKIRFNAQLIYFFLPFLIFIFKNEMFYTYIFFFLLFLYGIIEGSIFCSSYLNKKNNRMLNHSLLFLLKKGIKNTNLFFISLLIFILLIILL